MKEKNFAYEYHGALCNSLIFEENKHYITVRNEYNEIMYRGREEYYEEFEADLKGGKLA